MFERDSNKVATIFNRNECTEVFVFLGSILEFPNSILRIAEQEAGSVHAIRLESVRDLLSLVRDRSISVRKVFFDDRLATEILRDLELYHAGLPKADWILAYRDPRIARRLLRARETSQGLADILLLPMNLPICPWSAMLRLVLAGQFIASGDLIGPVDAPQARRKESGERASPAPHAHEAVEMAEEVQCQTGGEHGLTRREKEVLALVSQGGRNKTIAHKMSLSEHTVKLHLHNAITKIGARNRTEAATWYLSRQMEGGHEL
ncbi:MAG: response regulator transcription factor [Paracoccaceae bacterium]|uniref:helix-turn-helix transcriptional regulator n=1 Tax=Seohaeicola saemankumensis TaxID=481181 RepID=UPI001E6291D6|nr:helix-turn-helix transcriptional regulator [Seohaeicola saemankumensis]MCD1627806.1 LuxR C-terminal-related transcriptional regulator [Seohaeicola saemankumensis]